jgi:Holliday junction resolvase RusA-like endonuclease
LVVYRPRKAGDLSNRIKVLEDALNGIAWIDDKQIVEIHARREDDASNPRVEVRIEEAK